ncbi:MAG: 50S ribosomal protein L34 [Akkermansiaceae bacterium]|nr:50S ribosomal protein L34 [Akkermansiaceae bacterium]
MCRKTKTTSGFRSRQATPTGRRVLKARRKKGRKFVVLLQRARTGKNRI